MVVVGGGRVLAGWWEGGGNSTVGWLYGVLVGWSPLGHGITFSAFTQLGWECKGNIEEEMGTYDLHYICDFVISIR